MIAADRTCHVNIVMRTKEFMGDRDREVLIAQTVEDEIGRAHV